MTITPTPHCCSSNTQTGALIRRAGAACCTLRDFDRHHAKCGGWGCNVCMFLVRFFEFLDRMRDNEIFWTTADGFATRCVRSAFTSVLHMHPRFQVRLGAAASAPVGFSENAGWSGGPTQTIRSHCLSWVRTAGRKPGFTGASGQLASKVSPSQGVKRYIRFHTKWGSAQQKLVSSTLPGC